MIEAEKEFFGEEQAAPVETEIVEGKVQRTFLFALVQDKHNEIQLVGPASKPELRTLLDKLGDIKILKMIRGREVPFATKTVISFQ